MGIWRSGLKSLGGGLVRFFFMILWDGVGVGLRRGSRRLLIGLVWLSKVTDSLMWSLIIALDGFTPDAKDSDPIQIDIKILFHIKKFLKNYSKNSHHINQRQQILTLPLNPPIFPFIKPLNLPYKIIRFKIKFNLSFFLWTFIRILT